MSSPGIRARTGRYALVAALALAALTATPPARTAPNVLPTLRVSPTGNDAALCTQSLPCKSFTRAYKVAQPGQTVLVAAGWYTGQVIEVDPQKTSEADVVFVPTTGATVIVNGRVDVYGSHIELRSMTFKGGWYAKSGSQDLTFRNVSATLIGIQSARRVNVLGGEVGPWTATSEGDPKIAKSSATSTIVPSDILIDGTRFHDIVRPPGSGRHTECLQIGAAANLTIRNSQFENCAVYSVFISSWGPGYPLSNILVERNVFGALEGFHSISLNVVAGGEPCQGCTIRDNISEKPIATNVETAGSSVSVVGNTMSRADLTAPGWCDHGVNGVLWDLNVFRQTPTCGTNAVVAP